MTAIWTSTQKPGRSRQALFILQWAQAFNGDILGGYGFRSASSHGCGQADKADPDGPPERS